jgi:hypothetical protein
MIAAAKFVQFQSTVTSMSCNGAENTTPVIPRVTKMFSKRAARIPPSPSQNSSNPHPSASARRFAPAKITLQNACCRVSAREALTHTNANRSRSRAPFVLRIRAIKEPTRKSARYPSRSATAFTRSAVAALTSGLPRIASDAVDKATPASRATFTNELG